MVEYFKNNLESTYDSLCNVIVIGDYEEDGLVYNNIETVKYSNIRCSISHKSFYIALQGNIPIASMQIKLFISPNLDIPINSKIEITRGENVTRYKASSPPAIFDTHQEILLDVDIDV